MVGQLFQFQNNTVKIILLLTLHINNIHFTCRNLLQLTDNIGKSKYSITKISPFYKSLNH